MTKAIDTAAIENLRNFAFTQATSINGGTPGQAYERAAEREHLAAFIHLCTAALQGEEWAVERIDWAMDRVAAVVRDCGPLSADEFERTQLHAICLIDTTRPDGAIARSFQP